jgi:hypothetical protein
MIPLCRISHRHISAILCSLVLSCGLVATSSAQVVIQGFSADRDGPPNPFATLGFVTSPYYADVRQGLMEFMGPQVSFGTPDNSEGIYEITAEALAATDIFVVTGMNLALSEEELCLLDTFVAGGGAVLSFRNEWMPSRLMETTLADFGGTGFAQVMDPASPLVAGPFGTVDTPVRVGANSGYTLGNGWPVLSDGGRPIVIVFGPETGHHGRAVIVGDEEVFMNGPTPFGGDHHGVRRNNQLLLANIISYLDLAPGLDAAAADAMLACDAMCEAPGDLPAPDADGDGHGADVDCDDENASVHLGAVDLPGNLLDEDCDGSLGACDPGADWRNPGEFVSCVAREAASLVAAGSISHETGRLLIRQAAHSTSGQAVPPQVARRHGHQ